MNYSIGIDLGTTKTLVAYINADTGKTEIAHLGRETNSIPSTAYISANNEWEFGDDANDHALETSYVKDFKLSLGSPTPVCQIFSLKGYVSYTARDVTSKFLEHVRQSCETEVFNGHRVTSATITHPVNFSPAQLDDLKRAAEDAGFTDIQLMCEPEAAGLAFCRMSQRSVFNGTALVVDWGGGTLDLALISRHGEEIILHRNYVSGFNTLGGIFFDKLLLQNAETQLRQMGTKISPMEGLSVRPIQLKQIKSVKERLSRQESVKLILSSQAGAYPSMTFTRSDLEQTLLPQIKLGIDGVDKLLSAIQEASLRPEQILLIGGSSKIPCINEQITQHTGLDCHRWQFSNEAVALGAALSMSMSEDVEALNEKGPIPEDVQSSLRELPFDIELLPRMGCNVALEKREPFFCYPAIRLVNHSSHEFRGLHVTVTNLADGIEYYDDFVNVDAEKELTIDKMAFEDLRPCPESFVIQLKHKLGTKTIKYESGWDAKVNPTVPTFEVYWRRSQGGNLVIVNKGDSEIEVCLTYQLCAGRKGVVSAGSGWEVEFSKLTCSFGAIEPFRIKIGDVIVNCIIRPKHWKG